MQGQNPNFSIAEIAPGLEIAFRLEPLGMIFALIASALWTVTSIYAIGYMRGAKEKNHTRFYFFFACSAAFTLGIAFSANLLTLFIFYEALTLSTYPLVTHKATEQARKGGRVYLGILLATSMLFFLPAIIWSYSITGTLEFMNGGIFSDAVSPAVLSALLLLFFFGVGKAALMPFHRWLPEAMVAPTPVSALLHAVAVVKAGVFTLLKIAVYVFGIDLLSELTARDFLLYLAGASILLASFVAMSKDNLKARLAYSTISQLGYVTLGALLAVQAGVIGAGMHIAAHAFGKITLFFCAGAIYVATKKTNISEMAGLGKQMPLTMAAFFIGAMCIIGLPPTAGTWSKWFLMMGALDAEYVILMGVLMLSSLLSISYLLIIPVKAFFGGSDKNTKPEIKEAPFACLLAIGITVAGCLIFFLFPESIKDLISIIYEGTP